MPLSIVAFIGVTAFILALQAERQPAPASPWSHSTGGPSSPPVATVGVPETLAGPANTPTIGPTLPAAPLAAPTPPPSLTPTRPPVAPSSPATTPTPAARPTTAPTPDLARRGRVANVASRAPLRSAPARSASAVAFVPRDAALVVLRAVGGEEVDPGRRTWYLVRAVASGAEGYLYEGLVVLE